METLSVGLSEARITELAMTTIRMKDSNMGFTIIFEQIILMYLTLLIKNILELLPEDSDKSFPEVKQRIAIFIVIETLQVGLLHDF